MKEVKRAYFTDPVADGLLEAATIFAARARDAAGIVGEQFAVPGHADDPHFEISSRSSFPNLHIGCRRISTGLRFGAFIFMASLLRKRTRLVQLAWPSKMPPSPGAMQDGHSAAGAEDYPG